MHKLPVLLLLLTVCLAFLASIMQAGSTWFHANFLYHSTSALDTMFQNLVSAYPTLATSQTVGYSYEDHPIYLYKVGNPAGGIVFLDGRMHGDEDLGSEIQYLLMNWILSSTDSRAVRIRTRNYVFFMPIVNPDSYIRKNHNYSASQEGVDINRNFAYGFGTGGSGSKTSDFYRGPSASSENETLAVDYVFSHWNISYYLNMHMPVVNYVFNEDVYSYLAFWHGLSYTEKNTVLSLYYSLADNESQEHYRLYPVNGANGSIGSGGQAIAEAAYHGISSWLIELNDQIKPLFANVEPDFYPKVKPLFEALCELCELESSSPPDCVNLMNPSEAETIHTNTATFQYRSIAGGTIQNSSIWMNASGAWARIAWNSTAVLNNTICNYTRNIQGYGTPKLIKWNVQVFNSTTTSMWAAENRTFISDLAPYYEECNTTSTRKSTIAVIWRYLADGNGLSRYIWSWHLGTSSWQNTSIVAISGTYYYVSNGVALPAITTTLECRWYANDSDGQWSSSSIFSFTTTDPPSSPVTINANYHFLHGKTYIIPKSCTVYYGARWVSTAGTPMKISAYYENNWFNYTVTDEGIQIVHGDFQRPNNTWIDGSLCGEGDGWTYSISGQVTVTGASSSVQMWWGTALPIETLNFTINTATGPEQVLIYGSKIWLDFRPSETLAIQSMDTISFVVDTGHWNASANTTVYLERGFLEFTSAENSTFHINYPSGLAVSVNGVSISDPNYTVTATAGKYVIIEWVYLFQPIVPFMFILGMAGLGSMFLGPLLGIHMAKKKDYMNAFITAVVLTITGAAMFIAWLW